jgi:hypothetical protein
MGCCSSSNEIDNQEYIESSRNDSLNVSFGESMIETLYEKSQSRRPALDLPLSSSRLRSTSFSGGFLVTQGEGTLNFNISTQSNSYTKRSKNYDGSYGELMQYSETYN